MSSQTQQSLVAILIVVVIAFVILWVPIRLSMVDAEWGTAIVTEKYLTEVEDATFENLRYSLAVGGREFNGSSEVNESTYREVQIGDPLRVIYAAGDPSVNRYVGDRRVNSTEFAVSAIALLAIPVWSVGWWRSRSRRLG